MFFHNCIVILNYYNKYTLHIELLLQRRRNRRRNELSNPKFKQNHKRNFSSFVPKNNQLNFQDNS